MSKRSPKYRWLIRFLALVAAFFIGELLLRLLGTSETYIERTGHWWEQLNVSVRGNIEEDRYYAFSPSDSISFDRSEFDYVHTSNSMGFFEKRNRFSGSSSEKTNILVLGDSYVQGVGAPQDSTWVLAMERRLNHLGFSAETFNAGMSGSDPWFGYVLLEDSLAELKPDIVIVSINTSDVADFAIRNGLSRFSSDGPLVYRSVPSWEPIYRVSHFFRLIVSLFGYDPFMLSTQDHEAICDQFSEELVDLALKIDGLGSTHDFTPVFVVVPSPHDLSNEETEPTIYNHVSVVQTESLLEASGLYSINLIPGLKSAIPTEDFPNFWWPIDGHYNSKGYEVLGNLVADSLVSLLPEITFRGSNQIDSLQY